jgi:hypothetical protein
VRPALRDGSEGTEEINVDAPKSILLYRYLDAKAALKTIESRLLRISRLRDLNDPFESRIGVTGVIPGKEPLAHNWLDSILERQNTMYGFICFSDTSRESVLWSHYADKHKGVALEVRFDYDPEGIIEMRYLHERPTIDASIYVKLSQDESGLNNYVSPLIKRMIRQKSPGWAYEREYRIAFDLQKNKDLVMSDGHYFERIPDNFLIRVILGWRCPLEESYVAKALAASGLASTKVVRAKMSLDTYAVEC